MTVPWKLSRTTSSSASAGSSKKDRSPRLRPGCCRPPRSRGRRSTEAVENRRPVRARAERRRARRPRARAPIRRALAPAPRAAPAVARGGRPARPPRRDLVRPRRRAARRACHDRDAALEAEQLGETVAHARESPTGPRPARSSQWRRFRREEMRDVPEGLSAAEVGGEIGHHSRHSGGHHGGGRHDRAISISEAVLLSVVAIIAAWSGYSAAKWGTESSLSLAKASATRTQANRAFQQSLTYRVGDALTFNAWLGAHQSGDVNAERVAARRFLPELRPAFDAWLATRPFTNANAPAGPQAMPQYHALGAASRRCSTRRPTLTTPTASTPPRRPTSTSVRR